MRRRYNGAVSGCLAIIAMDLAILIAAHWLLKAMGF